MTFKSKINKMLRELYPRDGHKEVQKEKSEHIPLSPSVFRVTALYHLPPDGVKARVIRMGSIQSATYNNDIKFFIGHENFKNEIESLCKSRGMQFDCVEVVNVSFGNSDDVIEIVRMW